MEVGQESRSFLVGILSEKNSSHVSFSFISTYVCHWWHAIAEMLITFPPFNYDFRNLNLLAFMKILKKFEKVSSTSFSD